MSDRLPARAFFAFFVFFLLTINAFFATLNSSPLSPVCLSRSKYLFDSTHLPWLWLVASHVNLTTDRDEGISRYRRENPFFHPLHSASGCPRSVSCTQEIAQPIFYGWPKKGHYLFSITSQRWFKNISTIANPAN